MSRRVRWALAPLIAIVLLVLGWFGYSTDPTITGLRNIVHYQLTKWLGGPRLSTDQPVGAMSGTVWDAAGHPLTGAVVLVSSPLGQTYATETDPEGDYHLKDIPPGRYLPIAGKRGYRDGLSQRCAAGLCRKRTVTVRPGTEAQGVDFSLDLYDPPPIVVDSSLVVSPSLEVEVGAPLPSRARRTHFSFERAGLRINDCYLYEPIDGKDPLPTILLVLPGPVLGWEIIPVPFAAEGYSVLAFYPLRGTDIDEDAADILTALEYLRQGRLPSRADPERLALIGASFTSLHSYRLLALTDEIDVTLVLGGLCDAFVFRHDVEVGTATTRPPFGQVLMALGFPNSSPELYFRYSAVYHLDGLPPVCLLHGRDDELVPFNQSVLLEAELTRRLHPHEFYAYDGLKHYFSTSADNATTQQMWRDSLGCLRRSLDGE